jgi:hypothetical protein
MSREGFGVRVGQHISYARQLDDAAPLASCVCLFDRDRGLGGIR